MNQHTPLYPGKARIKVFYIDNPCTREELINIAKKLFPEIKPADIITKSSKNNAYSALSLDLFVENEEQLKTLYQEVKNHPEVKMVL
jgi:hypothetical protein